MRDTLIDFLNSIKNHEHEAGKRVYDDERESEEFVDIYLKDKAKNLPIDVVSNERHFFGKKKFVFNCEDSNKQALEMFMVADSQKEAELEFAKRYPKYYKWNVFEL